MSRSQISRRQALQNLTAGTMAASLMSELSILETQAAAPRATAAGSLPNDARLGALKDLNGYFPFQPSKTPAEWAKRREYVLRQLLVACGLWPMPERPAIEATVHGRVERDEYTVDRVYFESSPGLLVTGSLYRPRNASGPRATVLCPHGHWANGRFHEHGEGGVKQEIASGAEQFPVGGRYHLQARCVHLARMGCNVFFYDMQGYADNGSFTFDLIHRFAKQRPELSSPDHWGMFSAQSEMRLINALGIQTWNSIRAVDWLTSLDDVDDSRIAVTGASGGGTQTFMLAALDERIAAAFPAVMVSTAMQGGCTCENASLMRVNTGNIEFAALVAPRPIAMTGANDWTVEIETKGLPELKQHFQMMGVPDNVDAKYFNFPHNYNQHARAMMYEFFNRHLKLEATDLSERDFVPLTREETTVFDDQHPAPELTEEAEVASLRKMDAASRKQIESLTPTDGTSLAEYRRVFGGALEVLIGRGIPGAGAVAYEKVTETERDGYLEYAAYLRHTAYGEEIPTAFLLPTNWNRQVVVWQGPGGKADLYGDNDQPVAAVMKLIKAGYAVGASDLLYQGEFLKDGQPLTQHRIVNNPREFAGYTLGYNHSLFAQRVHDILSLLSFIKHHDEQPQQIHLVGIGDVGAMAAAACALSGGVVSSLAVSTHGFRFGEITDIRDVNLLPGAVKYGDVPFMLALCAPTPMWLSGTSNFGDGVPAVTAAAYKSSGSSDAVRVTSTTPDSEAGAIADWLLSQA